MSKGRPWTKQEITYLKKYWPTSDNPEGMAVKMGRTYNALLQKAWQLGLKKDRLNRAWPPKAIRLLKKLYPDHSCEEIGKLVGKKAGTVQSKAYCMGLRKDPEWMRKQSLKGQFKKGCISANKGKKWDEYASKESQEKMRRTCFKKGQKPKNYKPVGWERKTKDGYWEVKVAEPRTFKAKHRLLWEEHHGPIPKGVNIVFIDGNPDNITIENLRAETMVEKFNRCCSIYTTLPPELRELVQLKGALRRQLNKLGDDKPKRKQKRREQSKITEENE